MAITKLDKRQIKDYDTDWIDLSFIAPFSSYQNLAANAPRIRRVGNLVTITGVAQAAAGTISQGNTSTRMLTVPAGFVPSARSYTSVVQEGASNDRFETIANATGGVFALRYGPGTYPANGLATVYMQWITDDEWPS